ncbi:MAG: UDP-N-acetylmuramoyl-L-alanine--D-glutamate ligase [Bacteroidales bacterium]|nr:UDP-N-acetylmuramoyl-L-alanine--D-glutamate ligase [Bacteroidales bacterium]
MTEYQDNSQKFEELREKYPVFSFDRFEYSFTPEGCLNVRFFFSCNDIVFSPTQTFNELHSKPSGCKLSNEQLDLLVFNIGMIELISYWKACASPLIKIKCGKLSEKQIYFWKKLYWNGLGEYFYLNGLVGVDDKEDVVTIDNFVEIQSEGIEYKKQSFSLEEEYIVPIGGGKDSVVSLELLRGKGKKINPFVINSRGATKDCLEVAGFDNYLQVKRTIDKTLIDLNSQGYLNGHTPFSAMLAFTSLLSAALSEKKYIALSNESSANESTVKGMTINHQYSKSLEFEDDFRAYYKEFICEDFEYFSLLRPISELRIAQIFSHLPYFNVFKSCNVGSKQDIWCGHCPKCLFAYIILSPFIAPEILNNIFGKNMLQDQTLLKELKELDGETELKPFECVGTVNEVNIALSLRAQRYEVSEEDFLLKYWLESKVAKDYLQKDFSNFLSEESKENNLPEDLKDIFSQEYAIVKKAELARKLSNKTIGIMGYGREGRSTYRLLNEILPQKNFVVFDQNEESVKQNEELKNSYTKIFTSKEDYKTIDSLCDIIFLTPGIALKDIPEISLEKISNQCDVFLSLFKNHIIGISGTKGKSTTSTLTYEIIKAQHENTILAGNIGIPMFDIWNDVRQDSVIVLELSCHQLQNIKVAPKVSVLLNLFQEHLDHYNSYEEYQLAKLNLLTKGEKTDTFIYCKDSEAVSNWVEKFSLERNYKAFSLKDYSYPEPEYLKGEHNKINVLASLLASKSLGFCEEKAIETAMNFKGLNHRLQFVGKINEVSFYNDSISTIPQATLAALKALKNVSTLILGGMDRGIDYSEIKGVLDYGVSHIAFVGGAGKRMYEILKETGKDFEALLSNDWEEIVAWVKQKAEKNTYVLLSPAASSYDQFKNFEYRGRKFEELVLK